MLLYIDEENELVKPRECLEDPIKEAREAADAYARDQYWKHHGNKDDE